LRGRLAARLARSGEGCELLDGQAIRLATDELVIADEAGPVGFAGVMGGARSAIQAGTTEVLLEVAWFDPKAVAGRGRRHGIITDASQRFERGVDPQGQERALARAVGLICELTGGRAGALHIAELPALLPRRPPVLLRAAQVERLLGRGMQAGETVARLESLGLHVQPAGNGQWQVTPPSWRFDIAIEADLIEELARTAGYDSIPEIAPVASQRIAGSSESVGAERSVLDRMVARGYSEAVTFGFTDPKLQQLLLPDAAPVRLRNPIASDLAVMRASLWPGLLLAARENLRRQRERIRLFEIAGRFTALPEGGTAEQRMIAGLAIGSRLPEQWGSGRDAVDFHDVKADVLALLELTGNAAGVVFVPGAAGCLHPGRSARIEHDGRVIGQMGELHPGLARELDFTYAPILFELDFGAITTNRTIRFAPVSSFPRIRRDISFTVGISLPFGRIADRVSVAAGPALHELRLFDVYQGKGVESGQRSVALGLILQDLSRTLTDAEADRVVEAVCAELRSSLDARIRE
jgi:phenylalanyl-tRNA synthetase beta chain